MAEKNNKNGNKQQGKSYNKSYNNNYNKKYNAGKNGNQNRYNNREISNYVGAPYNFVPFSKEVYSYPKEKLTAHNDMKEELYTGELSYEITAQTPIIVSDGKKDNVPEEFHKDAQGRYAIPGSTMRGLIKNNVQILGLSSFDDDIDDYALMYRNVAGGVDKKRYQSVLGAKQILINNGEKSVSIGVLTNVKAGYMVKEAGKYVIYQTCVDSIKKEYGKMNYYILSERKVVQEYLNSKKNGSKFRFDFFEENGKSKMQHEFKKFNRFPQTGQPVKGNVHWKGDANKSYVPYYEKISYKIANEKDVAAVGNPGVYENAGYVMSTGKMNEKKVIYIIPEIDKGKEKITIPEADIIAFKADMEKKKSTLKQFGGRAFFDLPEDKEIKPVFYIKLGDRLYFGFTPRLRLFYDYNIKDGLPKKHKQNGIDYGKAIFGFSNQKESYKSKVSFSDAVLQSEPEMMKKAEVILSEPKPSSYSDYLKAEKGQPVTYNKEGFELRGVKQYWLHKKEEPCNIASNQKAVATQMIPLQSGAKFQGKVRFQNMTKDELGLLLWSIKLQEGSWMNVGKAKSFGYGNISIKILDAQKINMERAYSMQGFLDLEPFEKISVDDSIEYYKHTMEGLLNGRKIDNLPHIQDFFKMKDSKVIPKSDKIRYMEIGKKEYQSRITRKAILPTIDETIGK